MTCSSSSPKKRITSLQCLRRQSKHNIRRHSLSSSRLEKKKEGGKYNPPQKFEKQQIDTMQTMELASVCTSLVSLFVLVAQSFLTSARLFTSMPRFTRRRHYMHPPSQHLHPLSSFPFAHVDLQAFPTVESFPPPLVPPPPLIMPPRPRPLEPALSRWWSTA